MFSLALSVAGPAGPAMAEPSGCAGPAGYGKWRATQANFSQRVGLNRCADPFSETERTWVFREITRDCTAAAQQQGYFSMNTPTTWSIPRQPAYLGARFHVTGYINIQANAPYGTYPYASRYPFDQCLQTC